MPTEASETVRSRRPGALNYVRLLIESHCAPRVSTRKVDDLVKALGADTGISKSEVSRICANLDQEVGAFRVRLGRPPVPYVILDATYCKARVNRRVVSQAAIRSQSRTR